MTGYPLTNLRAFGRMVCPGGFLDRQGIKFEISALCRAKGPWVQLEPGDGPRCGLVTHEG